MHSIATLRIELGLATTNQVRNRIEAIKDLLHDQIRRGPNNQILLTDEGLEQLRRLQELYESGLTISEASGVMRADSLGKTSRATQVPRGLPSFDMKPGEPAADPAFREEIAALRRSLVSLEASLHSRPPVRPPDPEAPWWSSLREEIDVP